MDSIATRLSDQASACLHGAIAGQTCRPRRPAIEDMIIMEPPPARRIAGTAYFTERNTPSRFSARASNAAPSWALGNRLLSVGSLVPHLLQ